MLVHGHITWFEGRGARAAASSRKEYRGVTYDSTDGSGWSIWITWADEINPVGIKLLVSGKEPELFVSGKSLPVYEGATKIAEVICCYETH